MIGWVLLTAGGFLCVLNAYLSWLRYPLYRLRGGLPEEYRGVSGIPLLGSLLVALAWAVRVRHEDSIGWAAIVWILVAIDTGGLHWFLVSVVFHRLRGQGRDRA
jgi:hypothetical protein